MSAIHHALPGSNEALREGLHEGEIYLLPATDASLALADEARRLLVAAVGEAPRLVHARLANDEIFARIGQLRRTLYLDPRFHEAVRATIAALGFDPARCAFDPLRLRVILHGGHEIPAARAVYYPHRDTWYAHPQSMIAWWVPLDDLTEDETFVFFPERFRSPVGNDSEIFDYDEWVRRGWSLKIGWQDAKSGEEARYPASTEGPPAGGLGFACRRGENLLFSGSHYHRTLPQAAGRSRFSLDFRLVDLDDEARGRGAPNVDNRSRGSCLADYVPPGAGESERG
jgi:hypothetical protein